MRIHFLSAIDLPEVSTSRSGQGLHTSGIVNYNFLPLKFISERTDSIIATVKEHINRNADNYPPGLLDQYIIQLRRLEKGTPGCEIIGSPAYRPSASSYLNHSMRDLR